MIALSKTAALLISASTGEVSPVEYEGTIDHLKALLPKVEWFTTVRMDRQHVIFCDDEALLRNGSIDGLIITYKGDPIFVAGDCLITGDDEMGRNCGVTFDPDKLQIVKTTIYNGKEEEKSEA